MYKSYKDRKKTGLVQTKYVRRRTEDLIPRLPETVVGGEITVHFVPVLLD